MKIRGRILRVVVALWVSLLAAAPFAHAQDNLRDGAPFNGYTGVVFDTTNYAYDYLVDGSLSQDDPAHKRFKTLEAAYAAAPEGTDARHTIIGIKPNVYQITGTPQTPGITITKNYITLLGLTDDRRKVVLAGNRGNKEGAMNNGFVFTINAAGFTAMNLTFLNYCNLDYEYPGDPSKNLKMRSPVITQAVALVAHGDKHIYSHVAFLSRLDTLFVQTDRSYFTNVYDEGTDDFIGGMSVGVWEDSQIYFPTGGGVPSSLGFTFINTVFKAAHGIAFYKGFRNPIALIDCVVPVSTPERRIAWVVGKAPLYQNLYSLTYHTKDTNGHPAVIYDSSSGVPAFNLSRELSDDEVKAFNPWNQLRAKPNGPADDWDPAGVREKYAAHGNDVYRMAFAGSTVTYDAVSFTLPGAGAPSTIRTGGPGIPLSVSVSPISAQNGTITWSTKSPLVSLSSTTGPSIAVSGNNKTNHAEYVSIDAKAANGFYITAHVYVEPAFLATPAFLKKPGLSTPQNGKITVNYALDLGGRDDQSLITWYLCDDARCANRRAVAVTRNNDPQRQLTLPQGAIGKYVEVGIQPKHNISDPGAEVTVITARPIRAKDVPSGDVALGIKSFVDKTNTDSVNGMWTVLGNWNVTPGDNFVSGYGLRVNGQKAALLYQEDAPIGDMQEKVTLTPEKTAGQGFAIAGSPTDLSGHSQWAEIYIKYDPRTKNGYSLRFWRTIQSGEKCMFQLFKIVNGVGSPVDDQQQLSGVFKPNSTFILTVKGSAYSVEGSDTAGDATLSLHGTLTPNTYGGGGLGTSWLGATTPAGNSIVIDLFDISYPGK